MRAFLRFPALSLVAAGLSACAVVPPPAQRAPVYSQAPVYSAPAPAPQYGQYPPYGQYPRYPQNPPASQYPNQYGQYARVRSIEHVSASQSTSGMGGLAGAVVGAVIGRQFGSHGNGRAAGTAIGAVGGAIIGNEIERQQTGVREHWRVVVDLEQGGSATFDVPDPAGLYGGERVKIENNQIVRL